MIEGSFKIASDSKHLTALEDFIESVVTKKEVTNYKCRKEKGVYVCLFTITPKQMSFDSFIDIGRECEANFGILVDGKKVDMKLFK